MNNKTIKKVNLVIKLRGDHVYDLYLDDRWIASRGSYNGILDEASTVLKECLDKAKIADNTFNLS